MRACAFCVRSQSPSFQRYTAVFLQHEYGIFGGYRGEFIIPLLRLSASVPHMDVLALPGG